MPIQTNKWIKANNYIMQNTKTSIANISGAKHDPTQNKKQKKSNQTQK